MKYIKLKSIMSLYLREETELELSRREQRKADLILSDKISNLHGIPIVPIPRTGKSYKVVSHGGRPLVLIDMGTIKLPFYCSTGEGGKELVKVGNWFPIFGINGWFNKGSQYQINNYYGSSKARTIANALDKTLGDTFLTYKSHLVVPNVMDGSEGMRFINQDLSPTPLPKTPEVSKKYMENANNIISKIGGNIDILQLCSDETKRNLSVSITTPIGRSSISTILGDEAKYVSDVQFILKRNNPGWSVVPEKNATNQTNLNGVPISAETTLKINDVISIGKTQRCKIIIKK